MVCRMMTIDRQRSSASNTCRLTSSALSWGAWLVSRLWCWGWQFSYRHCKLLQYTRRVGNLPIVVYFVIVIVWSQAMPAGVGVANLGIKLGNCFFSSRIPSLRHLQHERKGMAWVCPDGSGGPCLRTNCNLNLGFWSYTLTLWNMLQLYVYFQCIITASFHNFDAKSQTFLKGTPLPRSRLPPSPHLLRSCHRGGPPPPVPIRWWWWWWWWWYYDDGDDIMMMARILWWLW